MTVQEMLDQCQEETFDFNTFIMEKPGGDAETPYCFVEKYDQDFYLAKIKPFTTKSPIFIPCGNKKNVIATYNYLKTKRVYFNSYKLLFFVDRDYDDNTSLSNDIFVTDRYSIENYYCSESVIISFLGSICKIVDETRQKEQEAVLAEFIKWKSDFMDATTPFCAWYMSAKGNHVITTKNPDYKNSFPQKLATINKNGINKHTYDYKSLNKHYSLHPPLKKEEYDSNILKIKGINDIRGKFVLQFIEEFIEHLRLTAKPTSKLIKRTFSFEKNRTTLMARLAFAADNPPGLSKYLASRLQNQIII